MSKKVVISLLSIVCIVFAVGGVIIGRGKFEKTFILTTIEDEVMKNGKSQVNK